MSTDSFVGIVRVVQCDGARRGNWVIRELCEEHVDGFSTSRAMPISRWQKFELEQIHRDADRLARCRPSLCRVRQLRDRVGLDRQLVLADWHVAQIELDRMPAR